MAGVSDKAVIPAGPWPAGIDNLNAETALTRSEDGKRVIALREAVNVDIPRGGWPRRRDGFGLAIAGTRMHSLWHCGHFPFLLYADGAEQFAWAGTDPFVVRSGLASRDISYAIPNDKVFCTNAAENWCVRADGSLGAWGMESPIGQPDVTAASDGGLDAGVYQVAITYLDGAGEESGTGLATTVDVAQGGGILLSSIPQPQSPDVARIRVYRSPTNGDVLYAARDVAVGQTIATIGVGELGRPLATQFLDPLPPGHLVRYLGGRLYVARGNEMRWSEALRYGLTHIAKNVRRIGENIDMMEPVGEGSDGAGLFVADHKRTYWIDGTNPGAQGMRIAYAYGAVRGTGVVVPGNVFGLETTMPVAYWLAKSGVACVGLPGGQVMPLRENQVVAPNADSGASLLREQNGIRSIVTALRGAQPQGMAIGDRVSGRVHRYGISE